MAGENKGDPAAHPVDSAGDQTSSDGAPAPSEAQTSGQAVGEATASGFGSTKENRVPYERFQKVNNDRKAAEATIAELQQQLELAKAQPQQGSGEVADQIQHLTNVARENYHDPDRFVEAMSKVAQLSAQGTANSTLEGLLQQQQQQGQEQQFRSIQEQSWGQALQEFPELNDQNSDFFKEAAAEYESDPGLQMTPTGYYRAAQAAYLNRIRQGGATNQRPAQLESGAPAPQPTADSGLKEDLQTLAQRGDRSDYRAFLAKHQPWKKPV